MALHKDRIRKILRNLDAHGLESELRKSDANRATAELLLVEVVRSGCFIQRRQGSELGTKQLRLRAIVEGYVDKYGRPGTARSLQTHLQYTALLQRAFESILERLDRETAHVPTGAVLLWDCFDEIAEVLENLRIAVSDHRKQMVSKGGTWVSRTKIKTPKGDTVDPDDVLFEVATSIRDTLLMFAYQFKWFDEHGAVVIPSRPSSALRADVGPKVRYLASVWNLLVSGEERLRFFDASVTLHRDLAMASPAAEVIELKYDPIPDLFQFIARQRQQQALTEIALEVSRISDQESFALQESACFPPNGYISDREALGILMLEENRSYSVFGEDEYGGLNLREWLRGYIVLASFADEASASVGAAGFIEFDVTRFLQRLGRVGFTDAKAATFLREVTFKKGKRDLHDAPVMKGTDGHCYLFAGLARETVPWEALSSQIASLSAL